MRPGDLVLTPWGDVGVVVGRCFVNTREGPPGQVAERVKVGTVNGPGLWPATQLDRVKDPDGRSVNLAQHAGRLLKAVRDAR